MRLPPRRSVTKAGGLPSTGFCSSRSHRYYAPLGLPLCTASFRFRLIPAVLPFKGHTGGPLLFRRRPSQRAVPHTPRESLAAIRVLHEVFRLRPSRVKLGLPTFRFCNLTGQQDSLHGTARWLAPVTSGFPPGWFGPCASLRRRDFARRRTPSTELPGLCSDRTCFRIPAPSPPAAVRTSFQEAHRSARGQVGSLRGRYFAHLLV